jgi:V/A-type H+/Na+-transporting ATPase subunit E
MPQNIETFVKTLESEGVNAGKKAAEKIQADAREQAQKIIAEAASQAEKIIALAGSEAEKIKTRMNSSLQLAARDIVSMLRERLSSQIASILNRKVQQALGNEDTLAGILSEVIPVYAKADVQKKLVSELNISKDIKIKLLEGTLRELTDSLKGQNVQIDVKQNLAGAGFEYKIEGSTVEVSVESVTAMLVEMIDPQLRQFLEDETKTGK